MKQHPIMGSDERSFPVIENNRLVGLVCIEDVRKAPRQEWDTTTVSEIMTPANQLAVATPRENAGDALNDLPRREVNQMPVVENGQLMGMLRRRDIVRRLQLHSEMSGRQCLQLPSPTDGGSYFLC